VGIGSRVVVVIGTRGVVGEGLGELAADVVCGIGAATVESRDEPLTTTSASTNPVTSRAAAAATIHNQRGVFGAGGGGGGGGYPPPGGQ
jgi:hypothetical protein